MRNIHKDDYIQGELYTWRSIKINYFLFFFTSSNHCSFGTVSTDTLSIQCPCTGCAQSLLFWTAHISCTCCAALCGSVFELELDLEGQEGQRRGWPWEPVEQQPGRVPVKRLASTSGVECLGVEQERVAAGLVVSQLLVPKPLGLKGSSSSSSPVPGPRCYWAGGTGEPGLAGGAHIGREQRVSSHRQAARQFQPLHHYRIVLSFHPAVVPLNQGGMAHVHQLDGGLLHYWCIAQNAPPDFSVVLQDEVPSGHCASPLLLGTPVDGTEPDKNSFNQARTVWPLGKWGSGGECVPRTLSTPGVNSCLFLGDLNLPVSSLLLCLEENTTLRLS